MKIGCLTAIVISLLSFETVAGGTQKGEQLPIDIRVYMSILSKKGNMLTDYEKDYMENLGHGDIKEHPIDAKTFHNAFISELENESQAIQHYDIGRQKLTQDQSQKEK